MRSAPSLSVLQPAENIPVSPAGSLSQVHKISAFANFYLSVGDGSAMIDAKNAKKGGTAMGISYNNLFKLLIDRGWSKTEFARKVGISSNTLAKLSKNEPVSLEVLVRICRRLECTLGDVVQILPLAAMEKLRTAAEEGIHRS